MRIPLGMLLGFLGTAPVSAAVSSLGVPSVDGQAAVSYNQWLASSIISSPQAGDMIVTGMSLRLEVVVPNDNVQVAITSALHGRPNLDDVHVLMDVGLMSEVPASEVVVVEFTPDPDGPEPILTAGEDYWIVFGVTALDWEQPSPGGLYRWSYVAAPAGYEEDSGWMVGGAVATSNTAGQGWSPEAATPYSFSLSVSPVPEPAIPALCLLVVGASLIRRRRDES